LIVSDITTSLKLYLHGAKFYLKLLSSFYILLSSLRLYEVNLIRAKKFTEFYDDFFEFLLESIEKRRDDEIEMDLPIPVNERQEVANTICFVFKFLLSVFIQYRTVCLTANELVCISQSSEMISKYKGYFDRIKKIVEKKMQFLSHKNKQELKAYTHFIELYELIQSYIKQFTTTKKTSSTFSLLKENASLEKKLVKSFTQFFKLTEKEKDKQQQLYYTVLLGIFFEFFFTSVTLNYINNAKIQVKFVQESLIDCFREICFMYAENTKSLHLFAQVISKDKESKEKMTSGEICSKTTYSKPMNYFNSISKLAENLIKQNTQSKQKPSALIKETCELLIENQSSYIKWLISNETCSDDDLIKLYYFFDNQTIKIAGLFYTDFVTDDYTRFQWFATAVCENRYKYNIRVNQQTTQIQSLQKTYRNTCDNLMLGLRTQENFEKAREVVHNIFLFLKSIKAERDTSLMEWLVMNFCKIKRDIFKSEKYAHKEQDRKITIVDCVPITIKSEEKSIDLEEEASLAFAYLFEELKYYASIKTSDNGLNMTEEIFCALEKMESLLSISSLLVKSRIQLELAQFLLNNNIYYDMNDPKTIKYRFKR
jgi:hypothetical protein